MASDASGVTKLVDDFYTQLQRTSELDNELITQCSKKPATGLIAQAWDKIHPEVIDSFFGIQQPIPDAMKGMKVLDVGCGAGRDAYLSSYLVGPNGSVTAVDATKRSVERCIAKLPYHAEKFGHKNVEFKHGFAEELCAIEGLEPASFDIIYSNGVICLTKDKRAVFENIFKLLKAGGEFSVSDIYSVGKPMPDEERFDNLVFNDGFGGAMDWNEFVKMTRDIGFRGPFVLLSDPYSTNIKELLPKIKGHEFKSTLSRFFKPKTSAEGAATKATYKGTIPGSDTSFAFSRDIIFQKGKEKEVPGEVLRSLESSRFREHFEFS
jgi:SAM-dependent methyltransferase